MTDTPPGIYLVNSTGEMVALHNEKDEGDIQLLDEYLHDNGLLTDLVELSGIEGIDTGVYEK